MQVILASTSPSRQQQLRQLGLEFVAIAPQFNEDEFKKNSNLPPQDLVVRLGLEKAASLKIKYPDTVLIGSDQLVVFNGEIIGKGKTVKRTHATLKKMSGQTHQLLTSLAVIAGKKVFRHLEIATIEMRELTDEVITAYIRQDDPLECAGGYKFERAGVSLMKNLKCDDPSAILGLPLMALTSILLELQIGFPFQKRTS